MELKLPPSLKSIATLPYSTVNSVHSDDKMFNYSKRSRGMLFLCFLQRLIYVTAQMRVLSRECHWSIDASIIVSCSMLCQTFIFITERNEQCNKQNTTLSQSY